MSRFILIVAAVLLSAAWVEGQSVTALYESDFGAQADGAAKLKGWRLEGGSYRIEGGRLRVTSDKSNPQAMLDVKHDGDGTFRATVRNAENCHRVALIAKGVYRLEVNRQFGRLGLERQTGGGSKLVAQAANWDLYARDPHEFEMRLVFAGKKVCGFVDDKKLIEYEDAETVPAGGAYGLAGGWGTDVAWRNISLKDAPDLSEWEYEVPPVAAAKGLVGVTWVRGSDDNIYFDGEKAGLRFKVTTQREGEVKVRLTYRLIDVGQGTVAEKSEEVVLRRGAGTALAAEFTPPRRGCFKIALYAGTADAAAGWVEDLGSFTVLPRALKDAARNADSYFGGHMDGIRLEWHLRCGRKLGIQWARCHDMLQYTWWDRIQPGGPDQWNWGDKAQAVVDAEGFSTLGEFLRTPAWAAGLKAGDGRAAPMPPKDEADFARYVAETVAHYRKSIHHWEVWNEPHYAGFWSGTPEQYAKMLAVAYREAKKADPDCFVLGGGGVSLGDMRWVEKMVAALPADRCMDGFSIHYIEPGAAVEQMARLRELLKGRGIDVPVWDTEASVPSTSFLDQSRAGRMEPEARYHFRNACYELVRMYMENLANGVQRVFYYEQADPWRFGEFAKPRVTAKAALTGGMWDEGRMLKPIAAAHAALALAIEGKRYKSRVTKSDLRAFVFEGKDAATAVQYAEFRKAAESASVRLKMPDGAKGADFTVEDFMGNETAASVEGGEIVLPLSRRPVYLTYRGARAGEVLGGMYAGATVAADVRRMDVVPETPVPR